MMERKEQRVWRVGGQDFILVVGTHGPTHQRRALGGDLAGLSQLPPLCSLMATISAGPPASLKASSTHIRAQV